VAHHGPTSPGGVASGTALKLPKTSTLPYSVAAGSLTAGIVALVLVTMVFGPRLIRLARRRSAPDFAALGEPGDETVAPPGARAAEALARVEVASPEEEPDPRRAVIAAWIAMTGAIAELWRPRRESEAPREYLQTALEDAGVRPASAGRLTDLFEEARFGGRTIGEPVRTEAISALGQVRTELRGAVPAGFS
jgi:hypothetical protein